MFDEKIAAALSGIVDIQSYLVGMGKPRPSFGESLLKSAEFKAFQDKRTDLVTKANIIGTGAANDPLVHGGKPFIDAGVRQPLTLRQLLPAFPTLAGAIELPVKTSSTNAAAIQDREGTAHGESAYGFESSFVPVQTLGHWVPASNQIFEDAGQLDGFIRSELLSDLAAVVEDQLLNGDGTNSQLTGLLDNATAYSQSSPITYTGRLDILRDAIYQVQLAKFRPNAIVLHPLDWRNIEVSKDSQNRDLVGLHSATEPMLWGLPVIVSMSIASGTFLVGDFSRAAMLFERETAGVQIARHDGSNFQKGLVTIRATERIALVITNSTAMVTGSL